MRDEATRMVSAVGGEFLVSLVAIVGRKHVIVSPDILASYETDWTGRWHGRCVAAVRPGGAIEASEC